MNERAPRRDDIACPFCGLLCDDLSIDASTGNVSVTANGCARSRSMFAAATVEGATALVGGEIANLDEAVSRAATLLRAARHPGIVAAGADVAAARAMVALAEHCRGSVLHANADAMARNQRVLRQSGWMATTLTEVRNRADLLVVAGEDIARRFPRVYERCFGGFDTLFDVGAREAWFLGPVPDAIPAAMRERARSIPIPAKDLAEAFAVMRALQSNRRLDATSAAGVPVAQLAALLDRMRATQYGVLAWSAAGLDFPHADLVVEAMCALVASLNETGRFSVLPLAGTDGDLTLQQVATWQTGVPAPVDFGAGPPRVGSTDLAHAEAIVFVSAFDPTRVPPASGRATIVLGHPGMRASDCEVFIPVGVPGVHHAGHLYRADSVVCVPLRRLAGNALPTADAILDRILRKLREAA